MDRTKARWAMFSALLLTALSWPQAALALEQKGVGEVRYDGRLDREERDEALYEAMRNAVETWVAQSQQSHYRNFTQIKDSVDRNITDYVLSHQVISDDQNKKQRRYQVVVRVVLNEPKLLDALLAPSAGTTAAAAADTYLTFVFVAREEVGIESRSEKTATQEKSRTQGIGKDREENRAAQTKTQTQTVSVNKSERAYDDQVLWDVSTSNEIDAAMGEVFTDAQYLFIDASLLEDVTERKLSVERFVQDYRNGDDIEPATKRDAVNGLAALRGTADEIQFLAIGTLDVETAEVDERTGNYRVSVHVTGQVLSILQRGAAVAKVGPETMTGEGPTELVAKNNALKAAAQRAAGDLVAKLSARNIR